MKKTIKQKFRIYNLCYGALCCAVSAAVALIAASILPVKSSHATAVLAILFSFVLSVAAGTTVFAARASRSQAEEEKLFSAIESIVSGNYEIRLGELSSSYEDAGKAIEKLAETLKNAEKAKADFIGDFSHELKTPIVSIRGFAKILAKGDLTEEEKREYADVIAAESERLIGLTTDTLLINKLDNDAFADANVSFSLSETLRKCILFLQEEWERKEIDVEADFEEFFYIGNERLLSQLFMNLIENAVKYSREGGKIAVHIAEDDKKLTVTVADNGIGMSKETLSRMYDKYFRGDKSRSVPGNGLGLSIVKRIADVTGAEVSAVSALGKGTEFTVILKK